jgi:tetraacyldisaccharide 4'-kinase
MDLLRVLLAPLALLYGLIIWVRNKLYDKKVYNTVEFDLPVIAIGNLTVGGTGKTPHIEYLIELLKENYHVATLSRGYGRKSRGYITVAPQLRADQVGDEPRQLKLRHPESQVVVCENRELAVPQILMEDPRTDVILMDDAFQHRAIEPGMSVLLTDFSHLYTRDYILPMGRLREPQSSAQRANVIIVTKCPSDLTDQQRQSVIQELAPLDHQKVFFSFMRYFSPYETFAPQNRVPLHKNIDVLLLAGIANPDELAEFLRKIVRSVSLRKYADHHRFDRYDLEDVRETYNNMEASNKIILTTEKDAMRLHQHREWIIRNNMPLYSLPVKTEFFPQDEERFHELVVNYVEQNRK